MAESSRDTRLHYTAYTCIKFLGPLLFCTLRTATSLITLHYEMSSIDRSKSSSPIVCEVTNQQFGKAHPKLNHGTLLLSVVFRMPLMILRLSHQNEAIGDWHIKHKPEKIVPPLLSCSIMYCTLSWADPQHLLHSCSDCTHAQWRGQESVSLHHLWTWNCCFNGSRIVCCWQGVDWLLVHPYTSNEFSRLSSLELALLFYSILWKLLLGKAFLVGADSSTKVSVLLQEPVCKV